MSIIPTTARLLHRTVLLLLLATAWATMILVIIAGRVELLWGMPPVAQERGVPSVRIDEGHLSIFLKREGGRSSVQKRKQLQLGALYASFSQTPIGNGVEYSQVIYSPKYLAWLVPAAFCLYPLAYGTISTIRGRLRRYTRRKRNRCLSCGYDLTGNITGICSECGCARDADASPTAGNRFQRTLVRCVFVVLAVVAYTVFILILIDPAIHPNRGITVRKYEDVLLIEVEGAPLEDATLRVSHWCGPVLQYTIHIGALTEGTNRFTEQWLISGLQNSEPIRDPRFREHVAANWLPYYGAASWSSLEDLRSADVWGTRNGRRVIARGHQWPEPGCDTCGRPTSGSWWVAGGGCNRSCGAHEQAPRSFDYNTRPEWPDHTATPSWMDKPPEHIIASPERGKPTIKDDR